DPAGTTRSLGPYRAGLERVVLDNVALADPTAARHSFGDDAQPVEVVLDVRHEAGDEDGVAVDDQDPPGGRELRQHGDVDAVGLGDGFVMVDDDDPGAYAPRPLVGSLPALDVGREGRQSFAAAALVGVRRQRPAHLASG